MPKTMSYFVFLTLAISRVEAEPPDSAPFNPAILKFCESHEGKRVGSGECSHLAHEALRVAEAEFTIIGADGKNIPDSPSEGDHVWGTHVKTYSFDQKAKKLIDSDPKVKCQPGDILQFGKVKIADGSQFPHHTAVVRTVDDSGNPTEVYQQNILLEKSRDGRVVQKAALQTLKMTSGKLMVYRAHKPTDPFLFQYTLTNNSKSEQLEFTIGGKKASLGAPNTFDGYGVICAGKGAGKLTLDGMTYALTTRNAYEFFTTPEGKIALREVK